MQELRRCARTASALALALIISLGEGRVHAQSSEQADVAEARRPPKPHPLRATLEELGLLIAGSIQYRSVTSNANDWDLGYDWPSFRKKLTGEAVRFDTNLFDTNMLTHPGGGALYYIAARGNHLDLLESSLFTAATSTIWEYFGEFREMASVNDLLVTPMAGVAIGEAFTQAGMFFRRSRDTAVNGALATLFAPSEMLHDWADGASPRRSDDLDRYGLTRDVRHRLELAVGASRNDRAAARQKTLATAADASAEAGTPTDFYFAARMRLLRLPGPDERWAWLTDGNGAWVRAEGAASSRGWHDLQLEAVSAPVGYYMRLGGSRNTVSHLMFVGATVGFDYALHDFGDDSNDRISGVHAAGIALEHESRLARGVAVHTGLMVRPEFAAVQSVALRDYLASGRDERAIATVAREQGYYFALGAIAIPTFDVDLGSVKAGAEARLEWYGEIEGIDRHQESIRGQVGLRDRRVLGRAWIAYEPVAPLIVSLLGEHRQRSGSVADVGAQRAETTFATTLGVVLR